MNEQLEIYLTKVEKGLRSLPVSERADIVNEIKSEMQELEGAGVAPEEIISRLGSPRDLAKSYLGEAIVKQPEFSLRKLASVLVFIGYAGISSLFVLPFTSISAVTFLACGFLCPVAGFMKFGAYLMGRDIPQIQFEVGTYSAGPVAMLPITLVIGALCLVIGWLCWRLTIAVIRPLSRKKRE